MPSTNDEKPGTSSADRKSKRYSIDGCVVQARESHFLGLFSKISKKHMVLDVSRSGIHFISRTKFKKGSKIGLIINAPILKGESMEIQGRVIRVKELPGLSTYGIGVEFIKLDPEIDIRLKTLIKSTAKAKGDISSFIDVNTAQDKDKKTSSLTG